MGAEAFGELSGDDRAEKEDLRRVVDPQQERDDRACGTVGVGDAALAEVETDGPFTYQEQHGRQDGARNHVAPRQTAWCWAKVYRPLQTAR